MNSTMGRRPDHRGADADAGEARFGDGRVDDPLVAELVEQALGHLVGALVVADLLAHDEDALVARHLFLDRLADGVAVTDLAHH